jgi:hypothetical protein
MNTLLIIMLANLLLSLIVFVMLIISSRNLSKPPYSANMEEDILKIKEQII